MNRIGKFVLSLLLLCGAEPALAGPLAPLIPVVLAALKAAAVKLLISVAVSVAVSVLARALQKKPRPPGMQTERKLYGGANSRSIMLGMYATAGSEVCPPMSHGKDGKTPNAYLTIVVAISDVPVTLLSRIIINGEVRALTGPETEYGQTLDSPKYNGKVWCKFFDGTQTSAYTNLVNRYQSYIRPWTAQHIGTGVSYAVLTYKYDADLFQGEPDIKFEVYGAKLYDPRLGGEYYATNPMVMIYNILRGIPLADGSVYGGECEDADLPLDNWIAAFNECEVNGGYYAGFEIKISEDQPADVIEELLKACSGEIVEIGGVYKVRVGPPALPVMFITDDDWIVTKDQTFDPFPGINSGKNTLFAVYPNPDEGWTTHEAPKLQNPDYLAQDGGVELTGDLQLPAVYWPPQVQRLMNGWLNDDRRWRNHTGTLGPYAFALEPLDVIAWTSARNGYIEKLFEIDNTSEDLATLNKLLSIREVDPTDYDWNDGDALPDPITPGEWELPEPQAVPGFGVEPYIIKDEANKSRRPALRAYWDKEGAEDAALLKIEVRNAVTLEAVASVSVSYPQIDGFVIISEGILPITSYEVRAQYVVDRPTEWSDWYGVISPNTLLGVDDIDGLEDLLDDMEQADIIIDELLGIADDLINSVDDLANEIIAAGGEIDVLQTQVATQGAQITTNATAISNVVGNLATLTNTVTAQGSSISQQFLALNNLTTTVGQHTITISSQGSQITNQQTSITNLTTSLAAATSTLSSQGATISNQQVAITNLGNSLATTNTTVGVQGATITTHTAALSAQVGTNNLLLARASVTLDVNGRITGWEINNNGSYGLFDVIADRFRVYGPGMSGANAPFQVVGSNVYIKNAIIQDLSVDTIKIAGNAISVPISVSGSDTFIAAGTAVDVITSSVITVGDSTDGNALIMVFGEVDSGTEKDVGGRVYVYVARDGGSYALEGTTAAGVRTNNGDTQMKGAVVAAISINSVQQIQVVLKVESIGMPSTSPKAFTFRNPKLVIMGTKR